ncbi:MAG: hypothetical protein FWH57_02750 [Oscillospiraceae bacterium]|nr:hypothetical protein [Oscillospiraceae bacterium]
MESLTWELLLTTAGCATATTALTQVIKKLVGINPKWIALFVAVFLSVCASIFFTGATAGGIIMAAINGVLSAGSSIGLFEGLKSIGKSEEKRVDSVEEKS